MRARKNSETATTTTGIAFYQKWPINTKMMKVGKGRKAGRLTSENEFYSEHNASTAASWREREKKKVITARLEKGRVLVARCVLELIVICVCV